MNPVDSAWNAFIAELENATDRYNVAIDPTGHHAAYKADEDEQGMRDASDDDLIGWVNDLEARVGMDTDDMRVALHEYLDARNASPDMYREGERVIFINQGSEHDATITTVDGDGFYSVICNGDTWSLVEGASMLRKVDA